MRLMRRLSVTIGCVWMLAACANVPGTSHPQAWLRPGTRVSLPVSGLSPGLSAHQLLTTHYRGREHSLMVLLKADAQQLSLVGLSTAGIRLFTLQYDARGLHTEQHVPVPGLPPASQVLADIMLSYWPVASWQRLLPDQWRLLDEGAQRQLLDPDGALVLVIDYDESGAVRQPVHIRQWAFGYDIRIRNLDD
jgi:hypothetical protein